ncbi:MAG TPA: NAD-dependent epimerase/dehydratase family protein, partial [Nitrospira sp.]|nr:NAD-dependent epimerase/dehydratase family protein [Nitrospira sp.]
MSSSLASSRYVLVTGVAGFLGSHLLDRLLAAGHRVIGIDDLSKGSLSNITGQLGNPSFRFLERDVTNPNVFSDLVEDVE